MRRILILAALLMLAACSPKAIDADPALWRITDNAGHEGWLFGTIHASDRPLSWRTAKVDRALRSSRTVMVEVANLANEAEVGAVFNALAKAGNMPPLSARIDPQHRPALKALLAKDGRTDADFTSIDTWAAALMLARTGTDADATRNGVDRAVIAAAGDRQVRELEGATTQLSLFDALPESEQRDLLRAVVVEATTPERDLAQSWRKGDMAAIEAETRSGLLADPQLRAVLFTGRNRRWTEKIVAAVREGQKPFVAVGAAHMAGPDGLPAMLRSRGFTVKRVE